MPTVTQTSRSRTSAQIALEDNTFHELFGMIWSNGGYTLKSKQDLSWAILIKDIFLQGLSDYANEGFVKFYGKDDTAVANREAFAHGSAREWVENDSPLNSSESVKNLRAQITECMREFHKVERTQSEVVVFNRKMDAARAALSEQSDPFSFDRCCETLGLEPKIARATFKLYRELKLKRGDKIRIVTYTGRKVDATIPSLDDIIEAEEANGEHDLTLFLHVGVKRKLRNSALVRSKNERSDQRDSQ
jgi:hypothetical protein